jgi:MYXO-CTERM domain-containing protein
MLLAHLLFLSTSALARDDGTCHAWRAAEPIGGVAKSGLVEISGMVASHAFPGTLWMHNDSGSPPVVYAVQASDGAGLGSWLVLGATNEDWEDIAIGPCNDGGEHCSCLYIADIGNNDLLRSSGVIWRVHEPDPTVGAPVGQTEPAEALYFSYPDGRYDAEAILVHPDTGEVLVVTKADGSRTGVYAFPDTPVAPSTEDAPTVLENVGWLFLEDADGNHDEATAGTVSPRGDRALLRSDAEVYLFEGLGGGTLRDGVTGEPIRLPAPPETGNAEAIAISTDGTTLYVVGEGDHPGLWQVRCVSFESDGLGDEDPLVDCATPEDSGSVVTPVTADEGCTCSGEGDSLAALFFGPAMLGLAGLRKRRPLS